MESRLAAGWDSAAAARTESKTYDVCAEIGFSHVAWPEAWKDFRMQGAA